MEKSANSQLAKRRRKIAAAYGFSLLEVVVGMVIVALILVPTTRMLSDVMRGEATHAQRVELLQLVRGKQSEASHRLRINFRDRVDDGSFASEGHPQLRYQIDCSQSTSFGGIPGRLMAVRSLGWQDTDNDRQQDPNELSVDLWTCVARATP